MVFNGDTHIILLNSAVRSQAINFIIISVIFYKAIKSVYLYSIILEWECSNYRSRTYWIRRSKEVQSLLYILCDGTRISYYESKLNNTLVIVTAKKIY